MSWYWQKELKTPKASHSNENPSAQNQKGFFVPVFFIFLEDLRISGRNQAHLNCFNLFEPKTKNRFGLQAQY